MRDFLVGPDGTIWVHDFKKMHPSPDAWTAIDSTGKIIGRLEIPSTAERTIPLQVISFGRDDVLIRRFDANRATYLTIYPLIKIDGRSR